MIIAYSKGGGGELLDIASLQIPNDALWIDVAHPTLAEETALEGHFGLDIPTQQERQALEESARQYLDDGALVLVVPLSARYQAGDNYGRHPVVFLLKNGILFTARDCTPRAFEAGQGRAKVRLAQAENGADVMLALFESLIERAADHVQEMSAAVDTILDRTLSAQARARLSATVKELGQISANAARERDSFAAMARALRFASANGLQHRLDDVLIAGLIADCTSLQAQAEALGSDVALALNAVLGLVATHQNEAMRVMAIITLLFAPATLITSFFGMNFDSLGWIHTPAGPLWAVILMAIATLSVWFGARMIMRR